jgi:hypothetical protein
MIRFLSSLILTVVLACSAHAQSTVNPNLPAQNSDLSSSVMRSQFTATYNDVNNILKMNARTSLMLCPVSPFRGTDCLVTAGSNFNWYKWDGTTWVLIGIINGSTHTFSASIGPAAIATNSPLSVSFGGGTATLSLNYASGVLALDGSNKLTLASAAANTIFGNPTGSSVAPSAFTIGSLTNKPLPGPTDRLLLSNSAASNALNNGLIADVVGGGSAAVISAAASPVVPYQCAPQNLGSVPLTVILDGVNIPNLSTHWACPQYPFTGVTASAEPNRFLNIPTDMRALPSFWTNRCVYAGGTPGGLCDPNNQGNLPAYSYLQRVATSTSTPSGTVLNFSATPPGLASGGLITVTNVTHPSSISGGTTVASFTGTSVVLSAAVASTVSSGDLIQFTSSSYRFFFTTVAKANSCTLAQTYDYFGDSSLATSTLVSAGLTQLSPTNPLAQLSGGIFTDLCWFTYVQQHNAKDYLLDYEPFDSRTTTDTLTFLQTLSAYVQSKGHKTWFYSNPISSYNVSTPFWTCSNSGLSNGICTGSGATVAPGIFAAFNYPGLVADSTTTTVTDTENVLASQSIQYGASSSADYAKLFVQLEMGGGNLVIASAVYDYMSKNGIVTLDLWNNFADWSNYSALYYQMTRCAVYGNPIQCGQISQSLSGSSIGLGTVAQATGLIIANAPPVVTGDGTIVTGATASLGGIIAGQGSSNDITIRNKNNTTVAKIATGTTVMDFTGLSIGGVNVSLPVSLANGGTNNASLTATAGAVAYSTATGLAFTPTTATTNRPLLSNSTGVPPWASVSYPTATAAGTVVVSATANTLTSTATPTLGVATTTLGQLTMTSGSGGTGQLTIQPPVSTALGSPTITIPAVTTTLVGTDATQTLTNKTIAGASNTLTVRLGSDVTGTLPLANGGTNNASLTATAGALAYSTSTGLAVMGATASNNLPALSNGSGVPAWATVSYPTSTAAGTMVVSATANTLTSTATPTLGVAATTLGQLTMTSGSGGTGQLTIQPPPSTILGSPTITIPPFTTTLAGIDTTQILTNKTIAGVSNTLTVRLGSDVTGQTPIANGGTGQSTVLLARASSGLNIDQITTTGDTAVAIAATTRVQATSAALTASRIWTLPAANALNAGQRLMVIDLAGGVTGSNTIVITRAGSDTINGGSTVTLSSANGGYILVSDGTSKWSALAIGSAGVSGVSTFIGRSGSVVAVQGDYSTDLIPGTTTGTAAVAGNIGEFGSASGAGVSLTDNTAANVVSVALGIGDYDLTGAVEYNPGGTTVTTAVDCWVSSTPATKPGVGLYSQMAYASGTVLSQNPAVTCPTIPIRLTSPTTVYLGAFSRFTTSTMSASGTIYWRRRR